MERFNQLILDEAYQDYLNKNEACEKTRVFCKHNKEHFLDVARLCYIISLESGYYIPKEIIYTCAFLHDIGRWQEYMSNIPHEEASCKLAHPLLQKYHFNSEEQQVILEGILEHRRGADEGLGKIMYKSDKLSRRCYNCTAKMECYWPAENKNMDIIY
ncbi:MAG: hypothetical protein K0S71_1515 [Clostridia bacterium]|jgi:uncharacterized protein|nr:hypothetical protein [Clostridia bacterium]